MGKEITLEELAKLVGGVPVGNARFRIMGVAPVENAGTEVSPGSETSCVAGNVTAMAASTPTSPIVTPYANRFISIPPKLGIQTSLGDLPVISPQASSKQDQ
jgi:hypothetical protein